MQSGGREKRTWLQRRQAGSLESPNESAERVSTHRPREKESQSKPKAPKKRNVKKRSGLGGCSYKAELVLVTFRRLSHRLSIDN